MIYTGALLVTLSLIFGYASASLYPIKPIANTIYDAGHLVSVEWIDSYKVPHLEDIIINRIDLYLDDDVIFLSSSNGRVFLTNLELLDLRRDCRHRCGPSKEVSINNCSMERRRKFKIVSFFFSHY
jgi:hypothetical protein